MSIKALRQKMIDEVLTAFETNIAAFENIAGSVTLGRFRDENYGPFKAIYSEVKESLLAVREIEKISTIQPGAILKVSTTITSDRSQKRVTTGDRLVLPIRVQHVYIQCFPDYWALPECPFLKNKVVKSERFAGDPRAGEEHNRFTETITLRLLKIK